MQYDDELNRKCAVCGEEDCNWYYGAIVCEACKKFFIRSETEIDRVYNCMGKKNCNINKANRAACQYCRYMKCLSVGLDLRSNILIFNSILIILTFNNILYLFKKNQIE